MAIGDQDDSDTAMLAAKGIRRVGNSYSQIPPTPGATPLGTPGPANAPPGTVPDPASPAAPSVNPGFLRRAMGVVSSINDATKSYAPAGTSIRAGAGLTPGEGDIVPAGTAGSMNPTPPAPDPAGAGAGRGLINPETVGASTPPLPSAVPALATSPQYDANGLPTLPTDPGPAASSLPVNPGTAASNPPNVSDPSIRNIGPMSAATGTGTGADNPLVPTDSAHPDASNPQALAAHYIRNGSSFSDGSAPGGTGGVSDLGSGNHAAVMAGYASDSDLLQAQVRSAQANDSPPSTGRFSGATAAEVRNARVDRENQLEALDRTARLSTNPREKAAALSAYAQLAAANQTNGSQERVANIREAGETARAAAANRTNVGIHQADNAVTARGQDAILAGHRMTNDVAVQNMQREQGNANRQYDLETQRFGVEQANQNLQQRNQAQKDAHDFITSILPPGPDGKPDEATAAHYTQGLNADVANQVARIQTYVNQHPEDTQAQQQLEMLKSKGLAAVDETYKRKFVAGMQLRDLSQQTHSAINPFGGTAVDSAAPVTSIRKRSGLISDDYTSPDGTVIPARNVDKTGSIFGFGGIRNNNFDILKQQ